MNRFPRADYAPLRPYAPDRRPVEVDLTDNTNLRGPHPDAAAAIRAMEGSGLSRYPAVYAQELKAAVAERFGVAEENVATGAGSDALIDHGFRASSPSGGRVSFASPTFVMVEVFARMNGLISLPVPWNEALAHPERLVEGDPTAIYLCSPNNPTGEEIDYDVVREVMRLAGPDGPPIFLDEAYADFAGRSMIAEAAASDRLVVLRTFSKAYGLAGLRVGIAVGAPTVIAEMEKSRGPYGVSQVGERAAVAALKDRSGWVEPVVKELVENRERLREELHRRGLRPLPSGSNFLLVPVGDAGSGQAMQIAEELRDSGVSVRAFPALEGVGDSFRVSVGPWEMMERFLSALDACPSLKRVGAEL